MISIYAAVSDNGVIGRKNSIPWQLRADMKRLAQKTKGHKIIMGQKTYESIIARLGKPLPERENIILTRENGFRAPGCTIVNTIEEVLKLIKADEETFIFGGGEVYKSMIPLTDKMYITRVHATIEGDTFFPDFDEEKWILLTSEKHQKDPENEFDYTYETYEKKE